MAEASKPFLRATLTLLMFSAGVAHFAMPSFFISIVPAYLPAPATLIAISGVAEILGAIGLLVPRTRRFSAWGLIALYICVFPANINMALHPGHYPPVLLWLRLPFQGVLIAWAYWVGLSEKQGADRSASTPS